MLKIFLPLLLFSVAGAVAPAQNIDAIEHTLDNGMKFLLVPKRGDPNVSAGWLAKVGSVNERPGVTGVAHLFEHMMFKGTHAIGTRDIEADLEIIDKLDQLRAEIQEEEKRLIELYDEGRISDPKDPDQRTEKHSQLLEQFSQLLQEQRDLLVKNEFDQIYTRNGGSGMNAGTTHDYTVYFINMPANKLELWFWMESDRLLNPVFREFYSERDVVHEERRMRVDSTPTGKIEEQFEAMFWQASPYSWPVIGWPSDLEGLTREEALEFFDIYYAPNNLTAVLTGDFDPEQAIEWAEEYFGRLERGPEPPKPVRTAEVEQLAEKRMIAYAETRPQVSIRYHTVEDGHVDEPPLMVLASLLNGRTGRLFKSLVVEKQVASQAGAGAAGLKYEGYFELSGVARPPHAPEDVEQALYEEIEKLQNELVGEKELQKVKNQQLAQDLRRLNSKTAMMFELLQAEGLGTWETVNTFSERVQSVTPEDVQRVARKYFERDNRNVAIYYTKDEAQPGEPGDQTDQPAEDSGATPEPETAPAETEGDPQ